MAVLAPVPAIPEVGLAVPAVDQATVRALVADLATVGRAVAALVVVPATVGGAVAALVAVPGAAAEMVVPSKYNSFNILGGGYSASDSKNLSTVWLTG